MKNLHKKGFDIMANDRNELSAPKSPTEYGQRSGAQTPSYSKPTPPPSPKPSGK